MISFTGVVLGAEALVFISIFYHAVTDEDNETGFALAGLIAGIMLFAICINVMLPG
jgi:hypothetical protein